LDIKKTLDDLEELLEEERRAILTLDAESVARIAEDKERALGALRDAQQSLKPMRENVARVVQKARHNCLLLANARDAIRGVVKSLAPELAKEPKRGGYHKEPSRGVRVSVMR
jgi:flagellar biosynthesis/type III secretory pathway chaperone